MQPTSQQRHWQMRRRCKFDLELTCCCPSKQANIFESEQFMVIVNKAASASSEINALVSAARFNRILTMGSRQVSMHRLRKWNISRIVSRAILESDDRRESASLVSCLTSECKVAPCCNIISQWNLHARRISLQASNCTFQSALATRFYKACLNILRAFGSIGVNSSVFK